MTQTWNISNIQSNENAIASENILVGTYLSWPAFNQVGLFLKKSCIAVKRSVTSLNLRMLPRGHSWSSNHLSYLIQIRYVACLTLIFILFFHHHSLYPQPSFFWRRVYYFPISSPDLSEAKLNPFTFLNNFLKVPKAKKNISSKQRRSYNKLLKSWY